MKTRAGPGDPVAICEIAHAGKPDADLGKSSAVGLTAGEKDFTAFLWNCSAIPEMWGWGT